MAGFWEALESTTKTEPNFGQERQQRFLAAERKARAFFEQLQRDLSRLKGLSVDVSLRERTLSFKRGHLELLAVTFGASDGRDIRVFSPIIEYLKLTPSYEDFDLDDDIEASAGRWLGRSIEALDRNRSRFAALGLS